MTEEEEFITKKREEDERETLQIPGARERYKICMTCDRFWPLVKGCSECYCFMPMKTRIETASCPIGKW